jgi:hypothetical protein
MHVLKINDEKGQTQPWWFNFLYSLRSDTINNVNEVDLAAEFAKWGARLDTAEQIFNDRIIFEAEEDLTWFLLKWS